MSKGPTYANAEKHPRVAVPLERKSRRICGLCNKAVITHSGCVRAPADGKQHLVSMMNGCEWCTRQWVRNPRWYFKRGRDL